MRAERADRSGQAQRRQHVEPVAERQLDGDDPGRAQLRRARRIAPDRDPLLEPGLVQGDRKAREEGFGAAMRRAGHRLQHAQVFHLRSSSKSAATSSQLRARL